MMTKLPVEYSNDPAAQRQRADALIRAISARHGRETMMRPAKGPAMMRVVYANQQDHRAGRVHFQHQRGVWFFLVNGLEPSRQCGSEAASQRSQCTAGRRCGGG